MASPKKKTQPADDSLEQMGGPDFSDNTEDGEGDTTADTASEDPNAEVNDPSAKAETAEDPADDAEGTDADQSDLTASAELPATPATDLHGKLAKAVQSIQSHGGQEKVFALHQLELLTGRLKMALPAGIAATEDAELRTGLEFLLGIL